MAHEFGGVALPIPVPASADEAVTDPGLSLLGDYLKAVILHYVGTAWLVRAPAEPVVRQGRDYNPEQHGFSSLDLPALYLWRQQDLPERTADDFIESNSTILARWVYPPARDERSSVQDPVFNGISKAVQMAVQRGKDPCWVADYDLDEDNDDRDLYAETHGSGICRLAGFDRLLCVSVEQSPLPVRMEGADLSFRSILMTFSAFEMLTPDPSVGTYPAKLELTVTTEEPDVDDALIFNERLRPDEDP